MNGDYGAMNLLRHHRNCSDPPSRCLLHPYPPQELICKFDDPRFSDEVGREARRVAVATPSLIRNPKPLWGYTQRPIIMQLGNMLTCANYENKRAGTVTCAANRRHGSTIVNEANGTFWAFSLLILILYVKMNVKFESSAKCPKLLYVTLCPKLLCLYRLFCFVITTVYCFVTITQFT